MTDLQKLVRLAMKKRIRFEFTGAAALARVLAEDLVAFLTQEELNRKLGHEPAPHAWIGEVVPAPDYLHIGRERVYAQPDELLMRLHVGKSHTVWARSLRASDNTGIPATEDVEEWVSYQGALALATALSDLKIGGWVPSTP